MYVYYCFHEHFYIKVYAVYTALHTYIHIHTYIPNHLNNDT